MFLISCPACQSKYFVGYRAIRSFENTESGPMMTLECPDGHEVEWHAHGSRRQSEATG